MCLIQICSILRTNYDNNNRRRRGRKKRKKTNKKKEKEKRKNNGMGKGRGMGRSSPIYGHQIMSKFISYSEIAEENTGKQGPSRIYLFISFFLFLVSKTCTAGVSPFD